MATATRAPRAREVIATSLALAAALLLGCSKQAEPSIIVSTPVAAQTPSAALSTTPAPTETPRATVASASVERSGGAAGAAVPAVAGGRSHPDFPPPPPKTTPAPPSASGMARMRAERLGLNHYIEDVGIVNGEMETPPDAQYGVGWYRTYDKPGVAGNAVFSAHETWSHMQGPFYGLTEARAGDEIALDMAGGSSVRYRVLSNTRYDVDKMPMSQILWPTNRPASAQWITLITCGGRLVYDASGFGEYLDRDVVIAQRFD